MAFPHPAPGNQEPFLRLSSGQGFPPSLLSFAHINASHSPRPLQSSREACLFGPDHLIAPSLDSRQVQHDWYPWYVCPCFFITEKRTAQRQGCFPQGPTRPLYRVKKKFCHYFNFWELFTLCNGIFLFNGLYLFYPKIIMAFYWYFLPEGESRLPPVWEIVLPIPGPEEGALSFTHLT